MPTRDKFAILKQVVSHIPAYLVSKVARGHGDVLKSRTISPWSDGIWRRLRREDDRQEVPPRPGAVGSHRARAFLPRIRDVHVGHFHEHGCLRGLQRWCCRRQDYCDEAPAVAGAWPRKAGQRRQGLKPLPFCVSGLNRQAQTQPGTAGVDRETHRMRH